VNEQPSAVVGDPSGFGTIVGSKGSATIDGYDCEGGMGSATHYHVHFSLFVNGHQYAIPAGTGIYEPGVYVAPYFVMSSNQPGSCYYAIHMHALEGTVHIEGASPGMVATLGQFLDIWGQQLSLSGFGPFSGPTRWFDTDESTGTPGSYHVTEQTGTDPHMIPMLDHHEYTVEIGPTYVNIPNYWFGVYQ
jgi:hypothetical protein